MNKPTTPTPESTPEDPEEEGARPSGITPSRRRAARGGGTQRERRPGVWEVRVPADTDPRTGRTRHVSITVHGTATDAAAERARLLSWTQTNPAASATTSGAALPPPARVQVGQLLTAWLVADHPWKPSTLTGYRSTVRALLIDPLAHARAQTLTPHQVRAAMTAWTRAGAGTSVVGGRFRALRACLAWAYDERLIDTHPLRLMRGPTRPKPRMPLTDIEVHALLWGVEVRLIEAHANNANCSDRDAAVTTGRQRAALRRVHRAEQDLLLLRLAADTGARRGELAGLQFADLHGRTLRIDRSVSAGQLTTPKSGHGRTMTLGSDTADLWHHLTNTWEARAASASGREGGGEELRFGPWLFTSDIAHQRRLGTEVLGHRFEAVRDAAGVPDATLHRLRHTVATFLVSRGQILQAQARLGHADAATTLREYSHALPATDTHIADAINTHLNQSTIVNDDADAETE